MTGKTKRLLFIHDHALDIAGMGGMTGKAFIILERRMLVFVQLFFHELGVACFTELVSLFLEEICIG